MSVFLFFMAVVLIILGFLAVIIRLCCELLEEFTKERKRARCREREVYEATNSRRDLVDEAETMQRLRLRGPL
jgi:Na+-transporting methylmalonyl-CoA/oxaloacetate decarboxylase gamma subunit